MYHYPVSVVVADAEDRLCDKRFREGTIVGKYMCEHPTITVAREDDLGCWTAEVVLAHELIHAVQDYRGINLDPGHDGWVEDVAHRWESSVAHELYPALRMIARQLYETGKAVSVDLCEIGILEYEPLMRVIRDRAEKESWSRREGL